MVLRKTLLLMIWLSLSVPVFSQVFQDPAQASAFERAATHILENQQDDGSWHGMQNTPSARFMTGRVALSLLRASAEPDASTQNALAIAVDQVEETLEFRISVNNEPPYYGVRGTDIVFLVEYAEQTGQASYAVSARAAFLRALRGNGGVQETVARLKESSAQDTARVRAQNTASFAPVTLLGYVQAASALARYFPGEGFEGLRAAFQDALAEAVSSPSFRDAQRVDAYLYLPGTIAGVEGLRGVEKWSLRREALKRTLIDTQTREGAWAVSLFPAADKRNLKPLPHAYVTAEASRVLLAEPDNTDRAAGEAALTFLVNTQQGPGGWREYDGDTDLRITAAALDALGQARKGVMEREEAFAEFGVPILFLSILIVLAIIVVPRIWNAFEEWRET